MIFWKTGVSMMPSRIHSPTATMTALRKNGMRQPQAMNWSPDNQLKNSTATVRQEQPAGAPNCGQDDEEAAVLVGARPLHRQQHRAAPFAADADALDQADDRQQDRAPDADAVVARHEADRDGGDAGHQQRHDQRCLAADAVTIMAKDRRADRPADEADEEHAERLEHADERIGCGKEQLAEHQRGDRAVEQEIVPLDGRADRAGNHGAAQLPAVLVGGKSGRTGISAGAQGSSPSCAASVEMSACVCCSDDVSSRLEKEKHLTAYDTLCDSRRIPPPVIAKKCTGRSLQPVRCRQ